MPSKSTKEAVNLIAQASQDATKLIAAAAADAQRVIANNAAIAAKVVDVKGTGDHDTLNTLVEFVRNMDLKFAEKFAEIKADIKTINDGVILELGDHEGRLRKLERQQWLWAGGMALAVFLSPIIFNWVAHLINK